MEDVDMIYYDEDDEGDEGEDVEVRESGDSGQSDQDQYSGSYHDSSEADARELRMSTMLQDQTVVDAANAFAARSAKLMQAVQAANVDPEVEKTALDAVSQVSTVRQQFNKELEFVRHYKKSLENREEAMKTADDKRAQDVKKADEQHEKEVNETIDRVKTYERQVLDTLAAREKEVRTGEEKLRRYRKEVEDSVKERTNELDARNKQVDDLINGFQRGLAQVDDLQNQWKIYLDPKRDTRLTDQASTMENLAAQLNTATQHIAHLTQQLDASKKRLRASEREITQLKREKVNLQTQIWDLPETDQERRQKNAILKLKNDLDTTKRELAEYDGKVVCEPNEEPIDYEKRMLLEETARTDRVFLQMICQGSMPVFTGPLSQSTNSQPQGPSSSLNPLGSGQAPSSSQSAVFGATQTFIGAQGAASHQRQDLPMTGLNMGDATVDVEPSSGQGNDGGSIDLGSLRLGGTNETAAFGLTLVNPLGLDFSADTDGSVALGARELSATTEDAASDLSQVRSFESGGAVESDGVTIALGSFRMEDDEDDGPDTSPLQQVKVPGSSSTTAIDQAERVYRIGETFSDQQNRSRGGYYQYNAPYHVRSASEIRSYFNDDGKDEKRNDFRLLLQRADHTASSSLAQYDGPGDEPEESDQRVEIPEPNTPAPVRIFAGPDTPGGTMPQGQQRYPTESQPAPTGARTASDATGTRSRSAPGKAKKASKKTAAGEAQESNDPIIEDVSGADQGDTGNTEAMGESSRSRIGQSMVREVVSTVKKRLSKSQVDSSSKRQKPNEPPEDPPSGILINTGEAGSNLFQNSMLAGLLDEGMIQFIDQIKLAMRKEYENNWKRIPGKKRTRMICYFCKWVRKIGPKCDCFSGGEKYKPCSDCEKAGTPCFFHITPDYIIWKNPPSELFQQQLAMNTEDREAFTRTDVIDDSASASQDTEGAATTSRVTTTQSGVASSQDLSVQPGLESTPLTALTGLESQTGAMALTGTTSAELEALTQTGDQPAVIDQSTLAATRTGGVDPASGVSDTSEDLTVPRTQPAIIDQSPPVNRNTGNTGGATDVSDVFGPLPLLGGRPIISPNHAPLGISGGVFQFTGNTVVGTPNLPSSRVAPMPILPDPLSTTVQPTQSELPMTSGESAAAIVSTGQSQLIENLTSIAIEAVAMTPSSLDEILPQSRFADVLYRLSCVLQNDVRFHVWDMQFPLEEVLRLMYPFNPAPELLLTAYAMLQALLRIPESRRNLSVDFVDNRLFLRYTPNFTWRLKRGNVSYRTAGGFFAMSHYAYVQERNFAQGNTMTSGFDEMPSVILRAPTPPPLELISLPLEEPFPTRLAEAGLDNMLFGMIVQLVLSILLLQQNLSLPINQLLRALNMLLQEIGFTEPMTESRLADYLSHWASLPDSAPFLWDDNIQTAQLDPIALEQRNIARNPDFTLANNWRENGVLDQIYATLLLAPTRSIGGLWRRGTRPGQGQENGDTIIDYLTRMLAAPYGTLRRGDFQGALVQFRIRQYTTVDDNNFTALDTRRIPVALVHHRYQRILVTALRILSFEGQPEALLSEIIERLNRDMTEEASSFTEPPYSLAEAATAALRLQEFGTFQVRHDNNRISIALHPRSSVERGGGTGLSTQFPTSTGTAASAPTLQPSAGANTQVTTSSVPLLPVINTNPTVQELYELIQTAMVLGLIKTEGFARWSDVVQQLSLPLLQQQILTNNRAAETLDMVGEMRGSNIQYIQGRIRRADRQANPFITNAGEVGAWIEQVVEPGDSFTIAEVFPRVQLRHRETYNDSAPQVTYEEIIQSINDLINSGIVAEDENTLELVMVGRETAITIDLTDDDD